MRFENDRLSLELSDNTGVILSLTDQGNKTAYVSQPSEAPFRVTRLVNGRTVLVKAADCQARRVSETEARITWKLEDGSVLTADITLLPDGAAFRSHLDAAAESEIILVEYPVIGGMGSWADEMQMVHSFATGLLVRNPLQCFKPGEGVRYAPYPECFSGASMQFFAYYGLNRGGLYFSAEDGESHGKWLNLYRNGDAMEAAMMVLNEDMGPGKPVSAPYAFTLRLMAGDGWFEAAERYKRWAVNQPWCAMGTLDQRPHCEWLLKDTGLTTFGISAAYDRSDYIRRYHKDAGTSVFHILGPDWTEQDFMGHCPATIEEWLPATFDQENLKAIREVGDHFAPFEFDFLVHPKEKDAERLAQSRHIFPPQGQTYSCDAYAFNMLCPCEDFTHDLHVERDRQITRDHGVDAMYYDISANNLLHLCLSDKHKHPKGGGNHITRAYQRLYAETKEACGKESGGYFPIGTEMINEVFLPQLDYYQARAGARPASALELWPYKKQIDAGEAELIPLFAAVYHEYGAVRMDGWGKAVDEMGDLFYDSAAKIYLWGGLYELNYEYSPMEAIDGQETMTGEHYWRFDQRGYEYAPGRVRYLGQFAAMRTGAGNPYLAYGRMMAPPSVGAADAPKHYWHFNHGKPEEFSGTIQLPSVRVSAWESGLKEHPGYAVFLANTELTAQNVTLRLDPKDYPGGGTVTLLTGFGHGKEPERKVLGVLDAPMTLALELAPRRPAMLEITPN